MKLRVTKGMPSSGSFIRVWTTPYGSFSEDLVWEDEKLYMYISEDGDGDDYFKEVGTDLGNSEQLNVHYISFMDECDKCGRSEPYVPEFKINS